MARLPTLRQLNTRHRDIIMRLVYYGQTKKEIAEELNLNYQALIIVTNTPLFKAELEKELLRKEKLDRDNGLQRAGNSAVGLVQQMLTEGEVIFPNGRKQIFGQEALVNIIRDTLDRAGHKPVEHKVETHVDLTSIIEEAWRNTSQADNDLLPPDEMTALEESHEPRVTDEWGDGKIIDITPEGEAS